MNLRTGILGIAAVATGCLGGDGEPDTTAVTDDPATDETTATDETVTTDELLDAQAPPDSGATPDPALARAASEWLGDGTPDGVELVEIYAAPDDFFCSAAGCRPGVAVDLEFNPVRPSELWVLFRQPYSGETCDQADSRSLGCQLMSSKVAIVSAADGDSPSTVVKDDGNSWHFMRVATSLAFADDDTFATVGEARTGNWMDAAPSYMGPTWWSSDPAVFAIDFGLNGSHLDMLHATPFGMGIAHDPTEWASEDGSGYRTGPIFWTFNGDIGAIDRYDFKEPHEPGGEDHSDGLLHRYVEGSLKRAPGISSHMEFASLGKVESSGEGLFGPFRAEGGQRERWMLYVADTGNRRVVRLDTSTGTLGERIQTPDVQIADPRRVDGAVLEEVVAPGRLAAPSGLAVAGEILFVGDADTSTIHAFDLEGRPLLALETGLDRGALAGLAIGPDSLLYVADWNQGRVLRVVPR